MFILFAMIAGLTSPCKLQLSASASDITCGQRAVLQAHYQGGCPPYQLYLNDSLVAAVTVAQDISIPGLRHGHHQLRLVDGNNCEDHRTIHIDEPPSLQVSATTETGKQGAGSVQLSIAGGLPPYQIEWHGRSERNRKLTELTAGHYTATITDRAGCSHSITAIVPEAPPERNEEKPQPLPLIEETETVQRHSPKPVQQEAAPPAPAGAARASSSKKKRRTLRQWMKPPRFLCPRRKCHKPRRRGRSRRVRCPFD